MRKIVELKQKTPRRRLSGKPPQEEEQTEQLQHQLQKLTEEYVNFRFREWVNRVAAFLSTCTVILDADDEEFHVPNLGLGMLFFFIKQNLQCKTHEEFFRAKDRIRYLEVHSNIWEHEGLQQGLVVSSRHKLLEIPMSNFKNAIGFPFLTISNRISNSPWHGGWSVNSSVNSLFLRCSSATEKRCEVFCLDLRHTLRWERWIFNGWVAESQCIQDGLWLHHEETRGQSWNDDDETSNLIIWPAVYPWNSSSTWFATKSCPVFLINNSTYFYLNSVFATCYLSVCHQDWDISKRAYCCWHLGDSCEIHPKHTPKKAELKKLTFFMWNFPRDFIMAFQIFFEVGMLHTTVHLTTRVGSERPSIRSTLGGENGWNRPSWRTTGCDAPCLYNNVTLSCQAIYWVSLQLETKDTYVN